MKKGKRAGRGVAQRPVLHVNEPKRTGACSAGQGRVARPKPTCTIFI
jgi:hypothetical protein